MPRSVLQARCDRLRAENEALKRAALLAEIERLRAENSELRRTGAQPPTAPPRLKQTAPPKPPKRFAPSIKQRPEKRRKTGCPLCGYEFRNSLDMAAHISEQCPKLADSPQGEPNRR